MDQDKRPLTRDTDGRPVSTSLEDFILGNFRFKLSLDAGHISLPNYYWIDGNPEE